jgi:hypothetical protein
MPTKNRESRPFAIDIGLHTTAADVKAADERITRIQNARPTQADRTPER